MLYLFNDSNKNYLRLKVFCPNENLCTNMIFLFDKSEGKEDFLKQIQLRNNVLLCTKTSIFNMKKSMENVIKGKRNEVD